MLAPRGDVPLGDLAIGRNGRKRRRLTRRRCRLRRRGRVRRSGHMEPHLIDHVRKSSNGREKDYEKRESGTVQKPAPFGSAAFSTRSFGRFSEDLSMSQGRQLVRFLDGQRAKRIETRQTPRVEQHLRVGDERPRVRRDGVAIATSWLTVSPGRLACSPWVSSACELRPPSVARWASRTAGGRACASVPSASSSGPPAGAGSCRAR